MLKFLLFLLLFFSFANADDKVAIYATTLSSKNGIVEANGGVSVSYKDYLLTANRATYNRKTGDLQLYDNIRVDKNGQYKILGNYAKLNIAKKEKSFRPFFMLDRKSQVWMSADRGNSKNEDITISSGVVSGCNPINPLWTIEFDSSDYNAKTKWVNLYNARLYIYDIPLFYTPYFGYSLDTTRRTGLLTPSLGLSSSEGLYVQQPLYIAEQNWWDLELLPQVRTNRGEGLYETFRFVDSPKSKGVLKAGYFQEKESYFQINNLRNQSHFGFNFRYENSDFLNQWFAKNYEGQSGLYVDINHMNDVDYINLTSNNRRNQTTATQILSRVNLFYNTNENYFATYLKYYEDLTLPSNDTTLQKIPTLHYHHYLNTLFTNHILYSLDVQGNNIYRKEGKKVVQTDINLPIALQTSLFDEYLNLSYQANLYMQHSSFYGRPTALSENSIYQTGYFARNYHTFTAATQLTKGYAKYTHVVGMAISYNQSSWETKTGYYKNIATYCSNPANQADAECDFYNLTNIENSAKIDFTQYLYNRKQEKIFYQRLSQRISYSNSQQRYGELENELDYRINSYISLYNNMFYNYDNNRFSKIFNKITLKNYGVTLSASHLYKDNYLHKSRNSEERYTSYLTTNLDYAYSSHYSYNASYNYDLQTKEKKSASIGFMYKKRCWNFGIKYAENNRPILSNGMGSSSIYDRYIYVTVVLKPFMKPRRNNSLFSYKLTN
ncbi:Outer membrane protein Imp, required for envelope biogenesis / Organic solvent tolerance protein precursor [hydrothermal vent metagenome]|uniref:Outer membrane protein Imp, required for envelope biogenesis / Organic solvent tolerance protein n=1 Tax=hydrothermal vent metagenome TaxID=652676 RepID=A0A1W1BMU8_9ZZZZ